MCQICLSGFLRLRRSHVVSFILTWISILYCSGFPFIQVKANLGKSYLFPLNCSITNTVDCGIPFQSRELECLWVYQTAFGKSSWTSRAFPVTGTLLKVDQSWQEWILLSWRTPEEGWPRGSIKPSLWQGPAVGPGLSLSLPIPVLCQQSSVAEHPKFPFLACWSELPSWLICRDTGEGAQLPVLTHWWGPSLGAEQSARSSCQQ